MRLAVRIRYISFVRLGSERSRTLALKRRMSAKKKLVVWDENMVSTM